MKNLLLFLFFPSLWAALWVAVLFFIKKIHSKLISAAIWAGCAIILWCLLFEFDQGPGIQGTTGGTITLIILLFIEFALNYWVVKYLLRVVNIYRCPNCHQTSTNMCISKEEFMKDAMTRVSYNKTGKSGRYGYIRHNEDKTTLYHMRCPHCNHLWEYDEFSVDSWRTSERRVR